MICSGGGIISMNGMERQYFPRLRICSWKWMPPAGMGSTMWRFAIRRAVDQQRVVYAHKLPGTLGGSVCSENIRQADSEPPHSPANGQHSHCVCMSTEWGAHIQAPYRTWRAASVSGTFRGASHCLQSTSQEFTTGQQMADGESRRWQMPNPEPFIPQPNGNCFLQYSGG